MGTESRHWVSNGKEIAPSEKVAAKDNPPLFYQFGTAAATRRVSKSHRALNP